MQADNYNSFFKQWTPIWASTTSNKWTCNPIIER